MYDGSFVLYPNEYVEIKSSVSSLHFVGLCMTDWLCLFVVSFTLLALQTKSNSTRLLSDRTIFDLLPCVRTALSSFLIHCYFFFFSFHPIQYRAPLHHQTGKFVFWISLEVQSNRRRQSLSHPVSQSRRLSLYCTVYTLKVATTPPPPPPNHNISILEMKDKNGIPTTPSVDTHDGGLVLRFFCVWWDGILRRRLQHVSLLLF